MRSRYSAYCVQDYQYILNTYATSQRSNLNIKEIRDSAEQTMWTALVVCSSSIDNSLGFVEFKAYYRVNSDFFVLHEKSKFIKEDGNWRYTEGDIQNISGQLRIKRNENCPCLSQKKYKRCCGK
jgi:SEC-C motif-containing protein